MSNDAMAKMAQAAAMQPGVQKAVKKMLGFLFVTYAGVAGAGALVAHYLWR